MRFFLGRQCLRRRGVAAAESSKPRESSRPREQRSTCTPHVVGCEERFCLGLTFGFAGSTLRELVAPFSESDLFSSTQRQEISQVAIVNSYDEPVPTTGSTPLFLVSEAVDAETGISSFTALLWQEDVITDASQWAESTMTTAFDAREAILAIKPELDVLQQIAFLTEGTEAPARPS